MLESEYDETSEFYSYDFFDVYTEKRNNRTELKKEASDKMKYKIETQDLIYRQMHNRMWDSFAYVSKRMHEVVMTPLYNNLFKELFVMFTKANPEILNSLQKRYWK